MNNFGLVVEALAAGQPLSTAESHAAVASILDGEVAESEAAAFLAALRKKGETADELEGAVAAVRERMTRWESGMNRDSLLDTCGTGGDGAHTVNISTAAAIVVASCGVPVVKHGNKAATSYSGSSDVLTALGVAIDPEPDLSRWCLAELKIAFLFAPRFHPGLARVAPVRRQLPFPTVFNLIGPLCNPAGPALQLVGVPDELKADLLARVLSRREHIRRAAVVTGCNGLDEVSLEGPTLVRVVEPGKVRQEVWEPEDFGVNRCEAAAIRVRDAGESAEKLTRAFEGEHGPVRDYVLANAAAALWVAGRSSLREGTALAASAIDAGSAAELLVRWRQLAPAKPAL
jgi:anthranilate phosphoribosyltransferase